MLNHSVPFEFFDFDPECELKSLISTVADRSHWLAPSDSFIKVAIKKGRDVVEASCRVASHAGEFVAEVVCNNPTAAIQRIESKIKSQLNEWKRRRCADGKTDGGATNRKLEIAV